MKKLTILLLSLLFVNLIFSQERAIKITNQNSQKEILIKENKRIKIKTTDGNKISGRFSIENNSILINNEYLQLTDIKEIKRNPLLVSILGSGLLIYAGAIIGGFAVIIGVLLDPTFLLLTLPAAGMIYAGTKSINFSKKYKNDGVWKFQFITNSD